MFVRIKRFERVLIRVSIIALATVGIIIAQIIRRTQLIELGKQDPFPIPGWSYEGSPDELNMNRYVRGLEEAENVNAKNNAVLRLVLILEKGIHTHIYIYPMPTVTHAFYSS